MAARTAINLCLTTLLTSVGMGTYGTKNSRTVVEVTLPTTACLAAVAWALLVVSLVYVCRSWLL